MRTRGRAEALLYVGVTVWLVGCGDPEQGAGPVGEVVPTEQVEAAPVASAALAQVVGLGLDQVQFPAPGGDDEARRLASRGPQAAAVAESTLPVDHTTPQGLLEGALTALSLEDTAALARLSLPPSEHTTLNEDDAARAERRFLGPATKSYWDRIASAVRSGAYEVIDLEGDRATVRVDVGGSAGVYVVQLRKVDDGWYLAG